MTRTEIEIERERERKASEDEMDDDQLNVIDPYLLSDLHILADREGRAEFAATTTQGSKTQQGPTIASKFPPCTELDPDAQLQLPERGRPGGAVRTVSGKVSFGLSFEHKRSVVWCTCSVV